MLLAGLLVLALASSGSSQSAMPADDALSPMEILSGQTPPPLASVAAAKADPADDALSPMEILSGQTPPPPAAASAAKPHDAKKMEAGKPAAGAADAGAPKPDGLGQCLHDWDAGTHMTRREWARTCRRLMADEARHLRQPRGR
jgi:hypothetical protein